MMNGSTFFTGGFEVDSPDVTYTKQDITAKYVYEKSVVENDGGKMRIKPVREQLTFKTERKVPKVGVMLVGLGGNNGSTLTGSIIANKSGLTWRTKEGEHKSNFFGSLTQASTVQIGSNADGENVYVPFKDLLPMVNPCELEIGGWDISDMPLGDAMRRAKVLDYDLQQQLYDKMQEIVPLPSIHYSDFIAANQNERANNLLPGTKQDHVDKIRQNIRDFKKEKGVDKVVVVWTANTERFAEIQSGLNDSAQNLLASIQQGQDEISPSTIFAVASILEGASYINGSPQNTFVPGVLELAEVHGVFIGGDDFKSGQTKMKSVLVDFLISAGIKVRITVECGAELVCMRPLHIQCA
jgi:myo-inositol-1-phosphate synthase